MVCYTHSTSQALPSQACWSTLSSRADNRVQEDPDRETGANESVPSCLHLRGKLNVGALEEALALLVRRHEVLHARYTIRHGEVLQVSARLAVPW